MNSTYNLDFPDIGSVIVTKKRGMSSIRMRISPKGDVHVSAPWSVPKSYIAAFVRDRKDWIAENTAKSPVILTDGMIVGHNTRLFFIENAARNHSSISTAGLHIKLKGKFAPTDKGQQSYIEKKVIMAMQNEAENILLPRLNSLANHFDHHFNQAYVKRLSSRWGSCDQDKNITLNVFIVQLPAHLRDYVMLHELTHTKYMNHSADFWAHMERLMPGSKKIKKELKEYHTRVEPRNYS